MLFLFFIVFAIATLCIIYLLFSLDEIKQIINTVKYMIKTKKEKKINQKEPKTKEKVEYYISPLFPNKEMMDEALKLRDKLYDEDNKK